jgi:fermentation-respiration switch protein FrsA (DUF1100 family)
VRSRLFWLLLLLAAGAAFVLWTGGSLVAPAPQAIGPPPADLHAEAVSFPSESGSTIHGWLCRGERRGSVLLLPGVRANRLSMVDRARFLLRAGYSAMLVDLQGTGESEGEAITFGWRERKDAEAAVEELRAERPREPVAVLGTSLGGAAALLANPPLPVQALVLESVYPTIQEATANRLQIRFGPPGRLLTPLLLLQLRPRLDVGPLQLRPVDRIGSVRCPVLVISGTKDRHTTVADTMELYRAAPEPKSLWLVPGAAHVDLHAFAGQEYERRVLEFVASSFRRGPSHKV